MIRQNPKAGDLVLVPHGGMGQNRQLARLVEVRPDHTALVAKWLDASRRWTKAYRYSLGALALPGPLDSELLKRARRAHRHGAFLAWPLSAEQVAEIQVAP